MTDLTEQWKKGELPDGHYYCKLILNNMKPSVERCKAHCIPMGVSADKGEEVLAPVPSYDEWQAKLEENAQLKELLKECELWFTGIVGNINDKNVGEHNRNLPIGNFEHMFKVFSQKINEALK